MNFLTPFCHLPSLVWIHSTISPLTPPQTPLHPSPLRPPPFFSSQFSNQHSLPITQGFLLPALLQAISSYNHAFFFRSQGDIVLIFPITCIKDDIVWRFYVICWFGLLVLVEGVRSEGRKVIAFVTKKTTCMFKLSFQKHINKL